MPLRLTPAQDAAIAQLRRQIMAGVVPLFDESLIAETSSVLAANTTGSAITVRPPSDGVIVQINGIAYAAGGDAEADTMAERMHEKFMGIKIKVGGRPKTNDSFESMYTLVPRAVCWTVAQGDLIEVTPKHLATTGIASLMVNLRFGFVPFELIGV